MTDDDDPHDARPPKRRAFQFSLFGLLAVVTAVAVICSLFRWLGPIVLLPLLVLVGPAGGLVAMRLFKAKRLVSLPVFSGVVTAVVWGGLVCLFTLWSAVASGHAPGELTGVACLSALVGLHCGMFTGLFVVAVLGLFPPARRWIARNGEGQPPQESQGDQPPETGGSQ